MDSTPSPPNAPEEIVFFERATTYRRWEYWVFLLLFGGVTLWMLVLNVSRIVDEVRQGKFKIDEPLGFAFGVLWLAAMLTVTIALAYRVIFKPLSLARIDEHGITEEGKHYSWSQITRVFTKSAANGVTLCYHRRGVPLDFYINRPPLLSRKEAEELLQRLGEFLEEKHPHVDVG